jgi:hypothetical protein
MEFQADIVTFEPCDDEYISFAFFRSQNTSQKHYLAISRSLEPGKEAEITLEVDDQSRVARGGVLEWKLDESRLTIVLSDRAAKDLGIVGSPVIVVDFAISRDSWDGLRRTFGSLFGEARAWEGRPPADGMTRALREVKQPSAAG